MGKARADKYGSKACTRKGVSMSNPTANTLGELAEKLREVKFLPFSRVKDEI